MILSTSHFFEQFFLLAGASAWPQSSPFGILPHESVAPTTPGKSAVYESFNAHFALKSAATRAPSPQVPAPGAKTPSQPGFFQVPNTFAGTDSKPFISTTASALQQSCIVSSPSSKDYRPAAAFLSAATNKPAPSQIQTKAQTKIYPESDRQEAQSYNKRAQFAAYRHYQQTQPATTGAEGDFQRPKIGSDYNTSGPDCSVVVPRRPSPLQAHSQASPIGHAQSPAYPMYNSPMNAIPSPQQQSGSQVTPTSPLDVSVPRPTPQTNNVAYPSVITRNCWEERNQQTQQQQAQARKFVGSGQTQTTQNQSQNGSYSSVGDASRAPSLSERQQAYFDSGHQVTLQDLSSCRGDPMSIVKNLQQTQTCQVAQQGEVKQEVKRLEATWTL